MSQRGDRGEGHARRPSRSSSFGGHRGGGVGGAAKGGGGPSGGQPPLSSNRSFNKPRNGHGGHQRVVNQTDTTGFQPAPAPGPLQTPPRPPVPQNAPVHVPVSAPRPQHHDSSAVQAPLMAPPSENPTYVPIPKNIPRAAPRAPSKSSNAPAPQGAPKGESSKGFNLQFGSINMNVNGLPQFPARTSSAPPNLDEQKRNQVLPEGLKVAPSVPIPPALKQPHPPPQQQQQQHPPPQPPQQQHPPPQQQHPPQPQQQHSPQPQQQHPPQLQQQHPPSQQQQQLPQQQQTRKDALGHSQPNAVNTHVPSQVKRDVHVSPSIPNVAPPRPTVQPIPGMPMSSLHFHHQQPQVPLQFGGHNQGVVPSSMQMSMGLPGGNASQVQQHMYVQNMQQHQMHQQMMHQGQTMMFPSVGGHQLPPQLGNVSLNMAQQYPQQHQNKLVGPRKSAIKIIDPHTNKEVKLGQRASTNVTQQPQQVSGFNQPMVYYPSQQTSYNPSGMYYPNTTSVGQVPTGSQARFSYPTTQAAQSIPFTNPSMSNTASASHKDNIAGPAASGQPQITGKSQVLHMEKPVAPVKISVPPGKSDAPKLRVTEPVAPHRQKDNEVLSNNPVSEKESKAPSVTEKHSKESKAPSVTEQHPTIVTQPLPVEATKLETDAASYPATNSPSFLSGADGKNKEAIQRTNSLKDNKKNVSRNDSKNLPQQPQSASSSEELKGETSVKVGDDGAGHMEAKSFNSKELDLTSTASGITTATSEGSVSPDLGTSEADNASVNAADVPAADISSAKSSSVITGEPQAVESPAVESNESEVTRQISPEVSDGKILSDCTENESHECKPDLAEQASLPEQTSLVISKPGNSDAATCVTDPEELPKESATSILEEHSSQKDMETSSAFVDGNDVSEASSVTSSESTIRSANDKDNISIQETAASSITPGMLPVNQSVASQEEEKHADGLKDQASADQLSAASAGSVRPLSREKPTAELTRTKSAAGKKKKRKEMLSKADAAGTSDLYNAYKGPEEQLESTGTAEGADRPSIVDRAHVLPEESEREGNVYEDDGKKKVEPDDWEDAADMSTPKLQSSGAGNQASIGQAPDTETNEANGRKKYSRDFLLTFAHQYSGLPVGIRMDTVTSALFKDLVGKSYVIDREPHPSPRGSDRPTSRGDRRGVPMDDDKWTTKSGIPFSPGRDAHMDLTNGPPMSYRGAPGSNHGVLRNPRTGLLVGPMQAIAPQVSRSGSDADRWQQRGLIPSPVTPMQIMHKAEKKYVVGKVSDEEQAKQRQLKSILNKLTPQNFDKLFEQVKEVNIDNVSTLTGVISQIFDKALMEPTFCEMYANFCSHLAGALPDFSEDNEKITFKRLLLNKCQEEFERGEREEAEADKTEEEGEVKQTKEEREEKRVKARRRMLGNIRLIGELYKKRMLTERIMHECIKKLLGNYEKPDEENIEALCKLMSTIGEMIDHPKAKEHMDAYFDRMRGLSTSQLISSRVRFLLRDSIDLRRNKWQQRRKVEGPKKIDEVHRDAAQEKHAQSSRLARGPVVNSGPRRGGPSMDYSSRGSAAPLASPGPQQRGRGGFGNQDIRFEQERHQFDNRTVPLPQRSVKDEAITLGPQGGLARGMSLRGQPPVSNAELPSVLDHRRMVTSPNGYNSVASTAREDTSSRIPDRISGRITPATQSAGSSHRPASQDGRSGNKSYSEEDLREKSIAAIREYYSAKDEKEVALCIEELNAPSFYPSVVSLWVNDSFERKDAERELLAKLFVGLFNGGYNLLSKPQLIEGLSSVLSSLEDALSDSPRASEYLGRLFARFVLENILLLQDVGRLIEEGGEEPGCLIREGIAADVLGAVLESIRVEKGDLFVNEAKTGSNLKLEDFRPQHLKRSKLDVFMST